MNAAQSLHVVQNVELPTLAYLFPGLSRDHDVRACRLIIDNTSTFVEDPAAVILFTVSSDLTWSRLFSGACHETCYLIVYDMSTLVEDPAAMNQIIFSSSLT